MWDKCVKKKIDKGGNLIKTMITQENTDQVLVLALFLIGELGDLGDLGDEIFSLTGVAVVSCRSIFEGIYWR